MSEALSSSEIEDVLSSIRRLVSDDMRPNTRSAPAGDADKLLLTPALRVVQSAPARAVEDVPALEEVMASVSAHVDAQGEEWESETGDQAPAAAEAAKTDWMLPDDGAEADYAEVDALVDVAEVLHLAPVQTEVEIQQVVEPMPGWAQAPAPDQDEDEAPRAEPWTGGTIEPDRAWADEAEAEVLQELGAAAPHADADEILLNRSEQDIPVNEEMLREIVRDVLREELQGRLGERITRNIRKLVRAEISRVMATDEFL